MAPAPKREDPHCQLGWLSASSDAESEPSVERPIFASPAYESPVHCEPRYVSPLRPYIKRESYMRMPSAHVEPREEYYKPKTHDYNYSSAENRYEEPYY